jgi:hypothetical protein
LVNQKNLVGKLEFAKMAHVSAPAISKACRNGTLAVTAGKIDITVEQNAIYLAKHTGKAYERTIAAFMGEEVEPVEVVVESKKKKKASNRPKYNARVKGKEKAKPKPKPKPIDTEETPRLSASPAAKATAEKAEIEIAIKKVEYRKKQLDYYERVGKLIPFEAVASAISMIASSIDEQFGNMDQRRGDGWYAFVQAEGSIEEFTTKIREEVEACIKKVASACKHEVIEMQREIPDFDESEVDL